MWLSIASHLRHLIKYFVFMTVVQTYFYIRAIYVVDKHYIRHQYEIT